MQALSPTQLESSVTFLINEGRAKAGFALRPLQRQAPAGRPQPLPGHGPAGLLRAHLAERKTFFDRINATGYTRHARRWLLGENLILG